MKKFGMAVATLCLMSAGALADEAVTPAQMMRVTTGQIVATVQIPKSFSKADQKITIEAQNTHYFKGESLVCTGHAMFQVSQTGQQVLKIAADQITMKQEAGKVTVISANGKVVIQIQQNGKLMQIMADSVVLGPQ